MKPKAKTYLGDSVYVRVDQFAGLVLTTENGGPPSNTIVLDPEVWDALLAYVEAVVRERKEARP